MNSYTNEFTQTVYANGEKIFENQYTIYANSVTGDTYKGQDIGMTLKPKNGVIYKIVYTYYYLRDYNNQFTNTVSYTMSAVENKLPLKKWTITDVINRTLDLAEPIRKGEKPRFKLQGMNWDGTKVAGSQAALFDKILAPEFAFTKLTLRECLQEVGKVVHGWYFKMQIHKHHPDKYGGVIVRYNALANSRLNEGITPLSAGVRFGRTAPYHNLFNQLKAVALR